MADVRPFRGLRYTAAAARDLSNVVCPPYDVINAELQERLHQRSPHNAVRIELPQALPTDAAPGDRYARAAAALAAWTAQGILQREALPAYYLLRQRFALDGAPRERFALFAAVRLEEFEKGVVLPHEYTNPGPKQDRLSLMQALPVNVSPVMALYRDATGAVAAALRQAAAGDPVATARTDEEEMALWRVDDARQQAAVRAALASQPLYLADGHHRYETAITYRDLMRQRLGGRTTGNEAWNFMMMALIDIQDPGLLVQPYHRMVQHVAPPVITRLRHQLAQVFAIEPFPGNRHDGWLRRLLATVEERGRTAHVLALLGLAGEGPYLLTQKQAPNVARWGPMARFEAWTLQELVLRPVLGEAIGQHMDYLHDAEETARRVLQGQAQLAFFLKPIPMDLFEDIVRRGHRLPPKSTYFWPKLPTGIVFNPLEGDL